MKNVKCDGETIVTYNQMYSVNWLIIVRFYISRDFNYFLDARHSCRKHFQVFTCIIVQDGACINDNYIYIYPQPLTFNTGRHSLSESKTK